MLSRMRCKTLGPNEAELVLGGPVAVLGDSKHRVGGLVLRSLESLGMCTDINVTSSLSTDAVARYMTGASTPELFEQICVAKTVISIFSEQEVVAEKVSALKQTNNSSDAVKLLVGEVSESDSTAWLASFYLVGPIIEQHKYVNGAEFRIGRFISGILHPIADFVSPLGLIARL